ncbi:MAG: hypothetical protein ACYCX2_10175 [Christensenellales bacterium]
MEYSIRKKSFWIRFIKSPYFPVFIFGCIILILHLRMTWSGGDEEWWINTVSVKDFNPFSFSVLRFNQWTSRNILELIVMLGVSVPFIVWKLVDTIFIISIAILLSKILVEDQYRREGNIIIASLMLLYTFVDMRSAGWICTTIVYIWPLAFGLIAIYPVRKIIEGKKIKLFEYFIYAVSLLIGANHEQMCIVLLAVYGVFAVYLFLKKRINAFVFIQLGLCLLSLFLIFVCPGNANRNFLEIAKWFPEYAGFSFLQKFELGLSVTLSNLFLSNNWLFFILTFFVFVLICQKFKNVLYRAVAAVPLFSFITLFALNSLSGRYQILQNLFNVTTKYGMINSSTVNSLKVYVLLFGMLFVCCTLFISLYILLGRNMESLVAIGLLAVGIATKVAIGFSPTVWASGNRTGLFMMFSLIACTIFLLSKWDFHNKDSTRLMLTIILMGGVYGSMINLVTL